MIVRWLRRLATHDVEAGASRAYPGVRPVDLDLRPAAAWAVAERAARAMPGWTLVECDREALRIRAEARTPRLGFVDDVTITVEELENGGTRIGGRSASRVGLYDFGTNARRLRRYLARVRATAPAG